MTTTRWYAAVGHVFRVRCPDPTVLRTVEEALTALPAGAAPGTEYALTPQPDAGRPDELWVLSGGPEAAWTASSPRRLLSLLLGRVNRAVVRDSTDDHVLLHAAAAERDGRAVVLAAPMESGKTTTVAGLVRAGWGYYTDEAVAVRRADGLLSPYAKPLSVDPGSWGVLADLSPGRVEGFTDQWQVPVTGLPGGRVAEPLRVSAVVLPRYRAGGGTALRPLSRADALVTVLGCTFGLQDDPLAGLAVAAAVVAGAQCWSLAVDDLHRAVALLEEVAAGADPPRAPWAPAAELLASGTAVVVVDGEAVCREPASGVLHRLDPTATAAWQLLHAGGAPARVATTLARSTGADEAVVAADVEDLVPVLVARGLLPGP